MKKYIAIPAMIVLLVVCMVLPAFASGGWYTVNTNGFDDVLIVTSAATKETEYLLGISSPDDSSGNNMEWYPSAYVDTLVQFTRLADMSISLSAGDKVIVRYVNGGLGGWLGGADNIITHYCWGVVSFDSNGDPVAQLGQSEWVSVNLSGNSNYNITWADTEIDIVKTGENAAVCLVLQMEHPSEGTFSMNNKSVVIEYGDPNSPEYPGYVSPDGGSIDDYLSDDQELQGVISGGTDEAQNIFSGFGTDILTFSQGALAAGQLFGLLFNIPQIGSIITISLAIGFVGFVFGIAQVVSSGISRSAAREESRSYRERSFAENKRYHDEMINKKR